jgi:hypothetical protein
MKITCRVNIPEAVRRGFNAEEKMQIEIDVTNLTFRERDTLSSHLMAQNFKNPTTHVWPEIPEPTVKGLQESLAVLMKNRTTEHVTQNA